MINLIEELRTENKEILERYPRLAFEFDWTGDAYRLQYNEEMIAKLTDILKNRT